jgi:hypothetical protein
MEDQSPAANLGSVIDTLQQMQAEGIIDKYAIGGAFAAVLHAEPISTIDLDIFFLFQEKQIGDILSLETLYDFSRRKGFSFDHEFINIHGWLVQFVESSINPLWSEAVETAETIILDGREIKVIDKEHLAASWLLAGRAKDFSKIAMFVSAGILDHKKLQDVLERHGLSAKWEKEKWRFTDEG